MDTSYEQESLYSSKLIKLKKLLEDYVRITQENKVVHISAVPVDLNREENTDSINEIVGAILRNNARIEAFQNSNQRLLGRVLKVTQIAFLVKEILGADLSEDNVQGLIASQLAAQDLKLTAHLVKAAVRTEDELYCELMRIDFLFSKKELQFEELKIMLSYCKPILELARSFNRAKTLSQIHVVFRGMISLIHTLNTHSLLPSAVLLLRAHDISLDQPIYLESMLKACQHLIQYDERFSDKEKPFLANVSLVRSVLNSLNNFSVSELQAKYDSHVLLSPSKGIEGVIKFDDTSLSECYVLLGARLIQRKIIAYRIQQILDNPHWKDERSWVITELQGIPGEKSLDQLMAVATPKKVKKLIGREVEEVLQPKTKTLIGIINKVEKILEEEEKSEFEVVDALNNQLDNLMKLAKSLKCEIVRQLKFDGK